MPEIIITKGDFRLEINIRELLGTIDGVTTVETDVEPAVPVEEATVAKRTTRRPAAVKPIAKPEVVEAEVVEPEVVEAEVVEPEVVEPKVEAKVEASVSTKDELIAWFMTVNLDLNKLKDDILPKYNIKRVSDIPDEQVVAFYNDLVNITI